jgi:hypothetical protein
MRRGQLYVLATGFRGAGVRSGSGIGFGQLAETLRLNRWAAMVRR